MPNAISIVHRSLNLHKTISFSRKQDCKVHWCQRWSVASPVPANRPHQIVCLFRRHKSLGSWGECFCQQNVIWENDFAQSGDIDAFESRDHNLFGRGQTVANWRAQVFVWIGTAIEVSSMGGKCLHSFRSIQLDLVDFSRITERPAVTWNACFWEFWKFANVCRIISRHWSVYQCARSSKSNAWWIISVSRPTIGEGFGAAGRFWQKKFWT